MGKTNAKKKIKTKKKAASKAGAANFVVVHVPPAIKKRLVAISKTEDTSMSHWIRALIEAKINRPPTKKKTTIKALKSSKPKISKAAKKAAPRKAKKIASPPKIHLPAGAEADPFASLPNNENY